MKSTIVRVLAVCLPALLLLAACGGADPEPSAEDSPTATPDATAPEPEPTETAATEEPAELEPVELGTVSSITNLPVTVAQARGYYEEEGVDLTVTFFDSGVNIVPALASGDLDIGEGSVTPALFNSFGREINQPIVAKKAGCGPGLDFCPIVVAQSLYESGELTTWSDIPGHTIAVSNLWTASHYKLVLLDEEMGVDSSSYEIISLPFAEMAQALETGAIDAAVIIEPIATGVESRGIGTRLLDGDHSPSVAVTYTSYSEEFLVERRDAGVAYLRGYLRGARDVLAAREAFNNGDPSLWHELCELPLVSETYPVLADEATRDLVSSAEFYPNATVEVDELRTYQEFYLSGEQLTPEGEQIDPADMVELSLLDEALEAVGRQ